MWGVLEDAVGSVLPWILVVSSLSGVVGAGLGAVGLLAGRRLGGRDSGSLVSLLDEREMSDG
jgi:hypothetical protein